MVSLILLFGVLHCLERSVSAGTDAGLIPLSRPPRDVQSPDCRQDQMIASLLSKVESLQNKIEEAKFLDRAFMVASLGERLTQVAQRVDNVHAKMVAMETIFMRSTSPSPALTENTQTQSSGLETKLEQYGKKILEQQNTMRNEARDLLTVARSFKSTLEDGMNKIFGKLNTISTKGTESEESDILEAVDNVKQEVAQCTASSASTKTRLDDIFTDLLSEWSASHKQMREIDIKLNDIKDRTASNGLPEEIELVAAKVRKGFERMEDLEPKVLHAVRVSTELENAAVSDDKKESVKMLSGNLSSTLKGLQNSLGDSLQSAREGIAIMDEFVVSPQDAKAKVLSILSKSSAEDITKHINENIDRKLQAIADQTQTFLSTEGLDSLNALRTNLQIGLMLLRREHEHQNEWGTAVQQGIGRVQEAVENAAEELRKCTDPKITDELRRELGYELRSEIRNILRYDVLKRSRGSMR